MESLNKILFSFSLLFGAELALAKKAKVRYLKNMYSSVHQNPSSSSTTLTIISCGHPVKYISVVNGSTKNSKTQMEEGWVRVKAGLHTGFMQGKFLSTDKTPCFQDKFPKFFESLELGPTEFYFWGRLYDNYLMDMSRPEGV